MKMGGMSWSVGIIDLPYGSVEGGAIMAYRRGSGKLGCPPRPSVVSGFHVSGFFGVFINEPHGEHGE